MELEKEIKNSYNEKEKLNSKIAELNQKLD